MADRPHAKILTRKRPDGRTEISAVDPKTGREVRTGLSTSSAAETEKTVQEIKHILEKGGNQVSYREV